MSASHSRSLSRIIKLFSILGFLAHRSVHHKSLGNPYFFFSYIYPSKEYSTRTPMVTAVTGKVSYKAYWNYLLPKKVTPLNKNSGSSNIFVLNDAGSREYYKLYFSNFILKRELYTKTKLFDIRTTCLFYNSERYIKLNTVDTVASTPRSKRCRRATKNCKYLNDLDHKSRKIR